MSTEPQTNREQASTTTEIEASSRATCVSCGYLLAGLEASGKCPECGTLVSESLRVTPFNFLNKDDADRLSVGVQMLIGALCVAGLVLAAIIIAFATGGRGTGAFQYIALPLSVAMAIGWVAGWHFVARVKVDGAGGEASFVRRLAVAATWIQTLSLLPFLCSLLTIVGIQLGIDAQLADLTVLGALCLMLLAGHWRLMSLAARGKDERMRLWGMAAGCAISVAVVFVGVAITDLVSNSGLDFLLSGFIAVVVGVIGVIVWVRFLILIRNAANARSGPDMTHESGPDG